MSSLAGLIRGILAEQPNATTDDIEHALNQMNVAASRSYIRRVTQQWRQAPQ